MRQAQALDVQGWRLIFCTLAFLLGVSQLAVALLNWLSTLLVTSAPAPAAGLFAPASHPIAGRWWSSRRCSTQSGRASTHLLETLEIHHLANRDPYLHFALLTDLRDAPAETLPEDELLLDRGAGRNRSAESQIRRRVDTTFSSSSIDRAAGMRAKAVWMGYERKRGKLTEFNALLRGGRAECFSEIVGEIADSAVDQIRHHARYRHATAARLRPAAHRHDGAPIEPAGVRSGRAVS